MNCRFAPFIALAGLLGLVPGQARSAELVVARQPVKDSYIVVLKDDAARLRGESTRIRSTVAGDRSVVPTVSQVGNAMARTYNLAVMREFDAVLRGFVVKADEASIRRLLRDERVDYVEQDGLMRASATQSNPAWGLDRIDQRDLPLAGSYSYATTASNVSAYIIDTGILASHSQFGGRVYQGFTAINDGNGSSDCAGHGTHVAGTVGGATYGVAKGVRLYPVRVLGCDGYGSTSGIIAGMDWVANNHSGPSVANMSLGGGASTATDQAVARLRNSGVTVVVAAGNENQDACNVSPARAAGAITVGSTTSSDARSSFSNWGSCVNIFAPGSGILSAWSTGNYATNTISGTSMATPHVAGAVALYLADNPSATPAQVEAALYANATPNKVGSAGSGSSNRLLFVGSGGGTPPDPVGTTVNGSLSATGYYAEHPSPYRWVGSNGTLQASITGPAGADFDLYLYRWSGSAWQVVQRAESPTSSESLQYGATPGYYKLRVYSYRGGGNYTLTYRFPD